jgi:hypothetical protein
MNEEHQASIRGLRLSGRASDRAGARASHRSLRQPKTARKKSVCSQVRHRIRLWPLCYDLLGDIYAKSTPNQVAAAAAGRRLAMDLFTRNSSLNPSNAACQLYLSFYNDAVFHSARNT